MKPDFNIKHRLMQLTGIVCFLLISQVLLAQEKTASAPEKAKTQKYVKNTFEGGLIIDNQTVMVPRKKTFEMNIMHRFGVLKNGYEDFYGLFAPSNIGLNFTYTPINNLQLGLSIIKSNMTWEGSAKYAIIRQTQSMNRPVSVTYFGVISYDSRDADFRYNSDRYMFFHQLLIARKLTNKLSIQVAPSITHVNVVDGYYSDSGVVSGAMKHDHFAVAFSGRYKIKEGISVIGNYDQPLTTHPSNNPAPNISLGVEFGTSSHTFQLFVGNYSYISPARNNYFNNNFYRVDDKISMKHFLIGFNIGRVWNY